MPEIIHCRKRALPQRASELWSSRRVDGQNHNSIRGLVRTMQNSATAHNASLHFLQLGGLVSALQLQKVQSARTQPLVLVLEGCSSTKLTARYQ